MTAPMTAQLGEIDWDRVVTVGTGVLTSLEPDLKKAAEKLATEVIHKVIIESEVSPPIVIDIQPAGQPQPGEQPSSDWIGKLIKPRVTLETSMGPMVIEPAGPPGPTKWPYIKWTAITVAALSAYLMWRGLTR